MSHIARLAVFWFLRIFMSNKIYVGGLSYSTSEMGLNSLFSKAGNVDKVSIIIDRETGRSKGFGFVEMASEAEAQAAIKQFHGTELDGRTLTVNEAKPQAPREGDGGRGGYKPRW
jgi:RNA recognition motif-containing protein